MSHSKKHLLAILALFGYMSYVVFVTVDDNEQNFKDFKVYVQSADNNDPYESTSGETGELVYQYMPLTRYLFKPFSWIQHNVSLFIYLILNILAVVFMVRYWSRLYGYVADPWFYLFVIVGINASLYLGFRSGNIVIIISSIIWLAIHFLTKNNVKLFCLFILCAACIKVTPILLLPLALLFDKRFWKWILISLSLFVLFCLSNLFLEPVLTEDFLQAGVDLFDETGIINPNLYTFCQEISGFVLFKVGLNESFIPGTILFILAASFIIYRTVIWFVGNKGIGPLQKISVALVLYALIIPRFKDYDYVLILPAAYFFIRNIRLKSAFYPLLFFGVLSSTYAVLPGVRYIYQVLWSYYPFIIILVLWALYLRTFVPKEANLN